MRPSLTSHPPAASIAGVGTGRQRALRYRKYLIALLRVPPSGASPGRPHRGIFGRRDPRLGKPQIDDEGRTAKDPHQIRSISAPEPQE
jgi:hypothetical protein